MNIKKYIKKKLNKILQSINIKKKYNHKIYENNKISDYQINSLIKISKNENINLKYLTEKIYKKIKKWFLIKNFTITKQGFINININKCFLSKAINKYSKIKNFGIKTKKYKTIIVDYSSPNIAKEMHIGHLRSTILGDSISNILKFLGNKIYRINHLGDWGTQFGLLIALIKEKKLEKKIENINDIENIYNIANNKFINNKNFAKKARKYVVKLQNKKPEIIKIWKKIKNITIKQNQKIYDLLKINLNKKNIMGESFYQKMLPNIINDLIKKKLAKIKKKAIIINKNNVITVIKKKDGAYLYNTTDIACAKYRYEKLKANKIIYVTDYRQKLHLKQIFYIIKKAKYIPKNIKLIHCSFGIILNKKGKPYKTRDGKNIKLKKIIKKAIKKSFKLTKKKQQNKYKKEKIKKISHNIAIAAIKWSDLSNHRIKNYTFKWKKIFSYKGNTGPYMQYAYTRIISILKKNKTNTTDSIKHNHFIINNKIEFLIAKKILNFEEILKQSSKNNTPHLICHYLYELTLKFSNFYETNNINNLKNIKIKQSKLKLISIIAKTIKIGLKLLGIPILNKM